MLKVKNNIHYSAVNARCKGKSIAAKAIIEFYIKSGKKLFLATSSPQLRYAEILKEYPNAKLKIVKHGVLINE